MNVEARVKRIICEQFDIADVSTIRHETSLRHDLAAESLDDVEILMALEDEFETAIADEDAEKFRTVGDIIAHISRWAS